jgi:L-asparaginase / beta-aspartyl-peptidase
MSTATRQRLIFYPVYATSMDGIVARHPEETAERAIEILKQRVSAEAGWILLDRNGWIWSYNSQDMAVAAMTLDSGEPTVFIPK